MGSGFVSSSNLHPPGQISERRIGTRSFTARRQAVVGPAGGHHGICRDPVVEGFVAHAHRLNRRARGKGWAATSRVGRFRIWKDGLGILLAEGGTFVKSRSTVRLRRGEVGSWGFAEGCCYRMCRASKEIASPWLSAITSRLRPCPGRRWSRFLRANVRGCCMTAPSDSTDATVSSGLVRSWLR